MTNIIRTTVIMLLVFTVMCNFFAKSAKAQTYQTRFTRQSCHQGIACRMQLEYGSAVCIGQADSDRWIFLTAAHGVSGAAATHVGLKVNGKPTWVFAKVIGWQFDQQADVAILSVSYESKLPCYTTYQSIPAIGADVELIGFPVTGYRKFRTKIRSRSTVVGLNQMGESGGPVLINGKLAGIQWGHSRSQNATYFTPIDVAHPFVIKELGYWPGCNQKAQHPVAKNPVADGTQLYNLEREIDLLKKQLAAFKQRESNQADFLTKLERVDQRLKALEPLLQRRIVLEDETGKQTASQVYAPDDTIRLRSRYRDRR